MGRYGTVGIGRVGGTECVGEAGDKGSVGVCRAGER